MDFIRFNKNVWELFGNTMFNKIFTKSYITHYFNGQFRSVLSAGGFYKQEQDKLKDIIKNHIVIGETKLKTAYSIMYYVNHTYPSSRFYTYDKKETWNTPIETIESFEYRKKTRDYKNTKECKTTDCDDYAILIYSLCRVAGLTEDDIYLCFNQADGEGYHLNCMFIDISVSGQKVPYVMEGTYRPFEAERNFGVTTFDNIKYKNNWVYTQVRYIFNDKCCFKNIIYK